MSLFKYFNERGGNHTEHGGTLGWVRNGEHYPLRNVNQIALTEAEVEAIENFADFHCKKFDLWVEADLRDYCEVKDRIENGWYMQRFIERQYMPEHGNWRILIEWIQIYGEIPPSKVPPELRGPRAQPAVSILQEGSPYAAAAG